MEMNKFDKVLEFVVLGGFLGVTLALMQWVVPEANQQLFSQGLSALTVIATLVAKSLWERNSSEAKLGEQRADNTGKAFDAIKSAAETIPAHVAADAAVAAEQVAEAAEEKADEIKTGKANG